VVSVAWHVTFLAPRGNVSGDTLEQVVAVLMPELSVAVGTVNVAVAFVETWLVGVTPKDEGQVKAGGDASMTVSGKLQFATVPALLIAEHVTVVVVET